MSLNTAARSLVALYISCRQAGRQCRQARQVGGWPSRGRGGRRAAGQAGGQQTHPCLLVPAIEDDALPNAGAGVAHHDLHLQGNRQSRCGSARCKQQRQVQAKQVQQGQQPPHCAAACARHGSPARVWCAGGRLMPVPHLAPCRLPHSPGGMPAPGWSLAGSTAEAQLPCLRRLARAGRNRKDLSACEGRGCRHRPIVQVVGMHDWTNPAGRTSQRRASEGGPHLPALLPAARPTSG